MLMFLYGTLIDKSRDFQYIRIVTKCVAFHQRLRARKTDLRVEPLTVSVVVRAVESQPDVRGIMLPHRVSEEASGNAQP